MLFREEESRESRMRIYNRHKGSDDPGHLAWADRRFRHLVGPGNVPRDWLGRRGRAIYAILAPVVAFLLAWIWTGEIDLITFFGAALGGALLWLYGEIIAEDGLFKDDEWD